MIIQKINKTDVLEFLKRYKDGLNKDKIKRSVLDKFDALESIISDHTLKRAHCIVLDMNDAADFPEELTGIAGSLEARIDTAELIAQIYREITFYLNNPNSRDWLDDYREHSCVLGRRVSWTEGETTRFGVAESIDEDGALLVQDEKNEIVRLHTGEISLRPLKD